MSVIDHVAKIPNSTEDFKNQKSIFSPPSSLLAETINPSHCFFSRYPHISKKNSLCCYFSVRMTMILCLPVLFEDSSKFT